MLVNIRLDDYITTIQVYEVINGIYEYIEKFV